jgi:uncharacterized protein (DUF1778 family)
MPTNTAARDDRIELRTTKEEKRLLASAAAYERLDVTSFIMRKVLPAAREVVDRAERIVLSDDRISTIAVLGHVPPADDFPAELHEAPMVAVLGMYAGTPEDGEQALEQEHERSFGCGQPRSVRENSMTGQGKHGGTAR